MVAPVPLHRAGRISRRLRRFRLGPRPSRPGGERSAAERRLRVGRASKVSNHGRWTERRVWRSGYIEVREGLARIIDERPDLACPLTPPRAPTGSGRSGNRRTVGPVRWVSSTMSPTLWRASPLVILTAHRLGARGPVRSETVCSRRSASRRGPRVRPADEPRNRKRSTASSARWAAVFDAHRITKSQLLQDLL